MAGWRRSRRCSRLRELAEERVEIDLLTPNSDFAYRPLEFAALFRDERVQRFDLQRIAADQGADLVCDRLEGVWPDERVVTPVGRRLPYDSLLIAIGASCAWAYRARSRSAPPGSSRNSPALLDDLETAFAHRLTFAAPAGTGWLLPLYELALMAADRLAEREVECRAPRGDARGRAARGVRTEASQHVDGLLAGRGIELLTGHRPIRVDTNGLIATPSERLDGRPCSRTTRDERSSRSAASRRPSPGSSPRTATGRSSAPSGVYAAGDGTAFPVKQGGLAAQQADAAASAIAAAAGADVEPRAVHAGAARILLTGHEPQLPAR